MEGKKKKNKKKKGNQAKQTDSISTAEDVNQTKSDDSVSNAEVLPDNDHGAALEMNLHSKAPIGTVSQSFGVSEPDFEQERHNLEKNSEELQEEINKIEIEKNMWSQDEGNLKERIKHLRDEVESCIQREDGLEERIKRVEEMNQSIALERQSSIKEAISNLAESNEGLQMQVMELRQARDAHAEENKHLIGRISMLESRTEHLETIASFYGSSKNQGEKKLHQETTQVLLKPDILNEEHSEKVSDTYVQPVQHSEDSETEEAPIDYASESHEKIPESNENIQAMATAFESFSVNGREDIVSEDQPRRIELLGFDDSRVSEDVVSVPLDDIVQELQPTAEMTVPISDAPLIGAPFRLMSFLTRYVSGADLVDRSKSGH